MPAKIISTEIFINQLRDTLRNPDNKICFILGAGRALNRVSTVAQNLPANGIAN